MIATIPKELPEEPLQGSSYPCLPKPLLLANLIPLQPLKTNKKATKMNFTRDWRFTIMNIVLVIKFPTQENWLNAIEENGECQHD